MNLFDRIFGRKPEVILNAAPQTDNSKYRNIIKPKITPLITSDQSTYKTAMVTWLTNGNNTTLFELFERVLLDTHLSSVIQQRILAVLAKPYHVKDAKGNLHKLDSSFQSEWVRNTIKYIIEAQMWGISVIEPVLFDSNGIPTAVDLVPRKNCRPRHGVIVAEVSDDPVKKGISYDVDELFPVLPYNGDLGLLANAAQDVISLRINQSAWSEHIQLYTSPKMVVKTSVTDPTQINQLFESLQQMNRSTVTVMDKNDDFQMYVNYATNSPYPTFAQELKDNITRLIIGQTMTTQSGASLSQAQVHQNTFDYIITSDCTLVESIFNTIIIPRLYRLGATRLNGARFAYDTTERVDITTKFNWLVQLTQNGYDVPADYVTDLTGIPVTPKSDNTNSLKK